MWKIDGIENATSNKSSCRGCSKEIEKDAIRGYFFDSRYASKRFLCVDCTMRSLKEQLTETQKIIMQVSQYQSNRREYG